MWPDGARCAASFTFDFDAEEVWIGEDPENAHRPGVLSQGTYAAKVAVPALLTLVQTVLVDHPGIELTILGTFLLIVVVFVPGGLVGLMARTYHRVAAWAAEGEAAAEEEEAAAGTEPAGQGATASGEGAAGTGTAAALPEDRAPGRSVYGTGSPQPP